MLVPGTDLKCGVLNALEEYDSLPLGLIGRIKQAIRELLLYDVSLLDSITKEIDEKMLLKGMIDVAYTAPGLEFEGNMYNCTISRRMKRDTDNKENEGNSEEEILPINLSPEELEQKQINDLLLKYVTVIVYAIGDAHAITGKEHHIREGVSIPTLHLLDEVYWTEQIPGPYDEEGVITYIKGSKILKGTIIEITDMRWAQTPFLVTILVGNKKYKVCPDDLTLVN